MNQRPLSVTIIGWLYILAGTVGFFYHFPEFGAWHPFRFDVLGVELVRLLAIVAGAFLLCGRNWARWVAIGWMAFHVVLSAFHDFVQLGMHCLFLALLGWLLLRRGTAQYFEARRPVA